MMLAQNFKPSEHVKIATTLSHAFLEAIPSEFRTHCVFSCQVMAACLDRFGLPSRVAPCQLMCTYQGRTILLGFIGKAGDGKWDGHAVVRSGNLLFDCATGSFKRDYGLELPPVVIAAAITLPSNVKAKANIGEVRLDWLRPPPGADTTLPQINTKAVEKYSELLFATAKRRLAEQGALASSY